tara:strand:+ start:1277 stop:2239 length:963 start_codon:yes stop_codon:yes gene_type:complete
MADRIIKSDSGNDTVIQNNSGSRKIEVTNAGDVEVTGDFKATTLKATNLKANDGTVALVISDSSGNVSFSDKNISNVGDISLDTISSDAGTSIGVTLGTDSGDDFNVGSGKFVVEGDTGKIGIGTSSPSSLCTIERNTSGLGTVLQLKNTATSVGDGAKILFTAGTSNNGAAIASSGQAADSADLRFFTGGSNLRMTISETGNIGAPSGTNIYNASDARLKQNVTNLSGSLEKIKQMQGVSFNWVDGFCDPEAEKTLYGLIAQDLQSVDSNLVDSFSDNSITVKDVTVENPLRVNEKFIIPVLIEAVKELSAKVTALEKS